VTLRARADAPYLRRGECFRVIRRCFALGKERFGFRLVQFTVQGNHLHLICEADDAKALSRGMQGLAIRIARRLNGRLQRRGKLFAERYHARVLRTPLEVRRALVYVLNNARRHAPHRYEAREWVDPCSSAAYFDGWRWRPREKWVQPEGEPPCVAATRWLLTTGWRRHGTVAFDEVPGAEGGPRAQGA
jgi:REP-associated tyrosine transposase